MTKNALRKTFLIDLVPPGTTSEQAKDRILELQKLVDTQGKISVMRKIQKKATMEYETYIGGNLLDQVIAEKENSGIDLLIVNNILKSRQIFNLLEALRSHGIEVWDRIDLILKIFELHANSAESKLQIELAKIRHMGPRIFGMGTELSRQGGGIGTSGIGETNTEIMRRHLKEHERRIFQKLEKVAQSKELQRQRRQRQNFKTLALVGYTNAGKSTLMNALTKKENIKAEDAFFVTLETRIGRLFLPEIQQEILLSDTIGFIADLPPDLISAFSSTLSEAIHADILLHVVDASDPTYPAKINVVDQILVELGISQKKQVLVFNKIDLLPRNFGKTKIRKIYKERTPLFVSATNKNSLEELKTHIGKSLSPIRARQ